MIAIVPWYTRRESISEKLKFNKLVWQQTSENSNEKLACGLLIKRCFFNKYTQRRTKNSHRPQVVWSIILLFVCITKTHALCCYKAEASEKIPVACTEINNTVCFHFFIFCLYFGPWFWNSRSVCAIFLRCVYILVPDSFFVCRL